MFSFKLQTLILRLPDISRGPSSSTDGNTKQVDTKFAGIDARTAAENATAIGTVQVIVES